MSSSVTIFEVDQHHRIRDDDDDDKKALKSSFHHDKKKSMMIDKFQSTKDNPYFVVMDEAPTTSASSYYAKMKLTVFILLWYASSALTNNLNKVILKQSNDPLLLTLAQFGITAWAAGLYLTVSLYGDGGSDNATRRTITSLTECVLFLAKSCFSKKIIFSVGPLTLFTMASHITTSFAISLIPVSFVHTIKGSAPLFTVIFSRYFLSASYTRQIYLSLLPLTLGIMLACSQELTFHYLGFAAAFASTIILVLQNLANKWLFQKRDFDTAHYIFYSCSLSFSFLLPIVIYNHFLQYSSETKILQEPSSAESDTSTVNVNLPILLLYYFLNGLTHYGQNVFALAVLNIVNPVTYSIASLGKYSFSDSFY